MRQASSSGLLADRFTVVDYDRAVKIFVEGSGMPSIVANLIRLAPRWKRSTRWADGIPYDSALLGDNTDGRSIDAAKCASLTAPTLVAYGEKGPARPPNAGRGAAATLPTQSSRAAQAESRAVGEGARAGHRQCLERHASRPPRAPRVSFVRRVASADASADAE